jgi:thiamine kinase-like enzyme
LLKKYFVKNKKTISGRTINLNNILKREIEGIKFLDSVKISRVVTPKIVKINNSNLWYTQEYYSLIPFNNFLLLNSNFFYLNTDIEKIFYDFGVYLARLHNKKIRIHGDLNQKNILFCKNKIFICDPSYLKKRIYSKPTFDIFRVINNFYPYNLIARLFICNKDKLITFFLKGYFSTSKNKIKQYNLKKDMIFYLKSITSLMGKGIKDKLKYLLIKLLNKKMISDIKNNRLRWLNEI